MKEQKYCIMVTDKPFVFFLETLGCSYTRIGDFYFHFQ